MPEKLTKDEKKALRKLEWEEKALKDQRNAKLKKYSIWLGAAVLVILAIMGLYWLAVAPAPSSQDKAVNVAPITKRDITEGNTQAKIILIEYADFQCPACAAYHPIINQLLATYKDKIYYAYRMFPLTNIHPNSHISAQAAYAAFKQGAFFQYDDYLFNNQNEWADLGDPTTAFSDYAKILKLDVNKFKIDMNSDEAKKYVNDSEQEALTEGMNATPTFILNGNKITNPSSYDDFKKLIDDLIKK